jgi:hypothetical protein
MENREPYDNTMQCGLWNKESRKGTQYISGKIKITRPGEYWVNIFANDNKKSDNSPNWNLKLNDVNAQRE